MKDFDIRQSHGKQLDIHFVVEKKAKKVVDDNEQTEILEWEKRDITNPYMKGDKVLYEGKTYVSKIDVNLTTPGKALSGWEEVL